MCTMWVTLQDKSVMPCQVCICNDGRIQFPEHTVAIKLVTSPGPKSVIFKLSGKGGIPDGGPIKQYARPQITQAMFESPLGGENGICQDNKEIVMKSNSKENEGIEYTLIIRTKFAQVNKSLPSIDIHGRQSDECIASKAPSVYASDAQRALLEQLHQWHISTHEVSEELKKMSIERKNVIMDHFEKLTTPQCMKNFMENWITIPTYNHLMVTELDTIQLHHATVQVGIANQNKHVIGLLVASQQTLVDIHRKLYNSEVITPTLAANAIHQYKQTPESRKQLRTIFVENLTKYVNIKTRYTFDTRVNGLFLTVPPTNTNVKVPGETEDHPTIPLFSPVVDEAGGGGEDYSLAGLTTAATHYMRCAVLPNIATMISQDKYMDSPSKTALLADCIATQNVLFRSDDCEGSASAIVGACAALRNGEISEILKTVTAMQKSRVMSHDSEYHESIKDVLFTVRQDLQETEDSVHVSLVLASGAQANMISTETNQSKNSKPTLASVVNDLNGKMNSFAGHAVATTVKVRHLKSSGSSNSRIEVVAIEGATTHEGTVETELTDNGKLCTLNAQSTDPKINCHLQQINNTIRPEYDADNIITQILSDSIYRKTGVSHTPTHKCNPKAEDSFYGFFMSSGRFLIFMHDMDLSRFEKKMDESSTNTRITTAVKQDMSTSRRLSKRQDDQKMGISPFASMILGSRYQDIGVDNTKRPPISIPYGITVPPSEREMMLIRAMADSMSQGYPDVEAQIQSLESTLYCLPYTSAILQDRNIKYEDKTKINCGQPVSLNLNVETDARTRHKMCCKAAAIRNIDSHCFAMYFD